MIELFYNVLASFRTHSTNCSWAWGIANSIIEPGNHPLNSIFISQLNSHLFASPLGSGLTACPPGIMAISVMEFQA